MLYADDAVVFAKSPEVLQSILNDIESYCSIWGLKINTAKTKAMIFETGRRTLYDIYFNNSKLEIVTSFKYLEIHFFFQKWQLAQDAKKTFTTCRLCAS